MALLCTVPIIGSAATLDTIGVTLLRAVASDLDGSGVRVAQAEAKENGTNQPAAYQVVPSGAGVSQPVGLFSYHSALGSSSSYPNTVGLGSGHANGVAANFYGLPNGVATNLAHVDSYYADYFTDTFIDPSNPPNPNARIVNQSFVFGTVSVPDQQDIDSDYDDAAARHNTLFVSGVGNGGPVNPPATCYNGIGVAAFGGSSSVGPTPDNGRSKPDITAPSDVTSFSTPQVAGAAALLLQAGTRGDGGSDTNAATDLRTLKALLLNGAIKPVGWTHTTTIPLDARHGSGVLNVFNSYNQLVGGKQAAIEQTTVSQGGAHPPGSSGGTIPAPGGWDFSTLSSTTTSDRINHYYFNVTNSLGGVPFTATATLVWNRQENRSAINDLDLFLYDVGTGALVAESISWVDNVEHLYLKELPPGRYDLQVLKYGGNAGTGRITSSETYALAWEFFNLALQIATTESNVILTWPIAPAGFVLESASSLNSSASWIPVGEAPVISNSMNNVELPIGGSNAFYRLRRP